MIQSLRSATRFLRKIMSTSLDSASEMGAKGIRCRGRLEKYSLPSSDVEVPRPL